MSARRRLHAAESLLERPSELTSGLWPRAVAFLARQALEAAVKDRLGPKCATLDGVPFTVQLICLPQVVEPALARDLAWSWAALSRACHHPGYELAPTAGQLRAWLEPVQRLVHGAPGPRPAPDLTRPR